MQNRRSEHEVSSDYNIQSSGIFNLNKLFCLAFAKKYPIVPQKKLSITVLQNCRTVQLSQCIQFQ